MKNSIKKLYPRLKDSFKSIADMYSFSDYESAKAGRKSFSRIPPSFAKQIRIAEYDDKRELFWMSDAKTPIAMYEIKGMATEGATEDTLKKYRQRIFELLSVFPQYNAKNSPWTIQVYAKDENDFTEHYERVKQTIPDHLAETRYSQTYLKFLKRHFDHVSRTEGLFVDDDDNLFRGKVRKVRLVFYRINNGKTPAKAFKEINTMRNILESSLNIMKKYDLTYKRINEKDYYSWTFHRFHQQIKGYENVNEYLNDNPFIAKENRPYGYDVIENALGFPIRSNKKEGWWKIGETYNKYISALNLKSEPDNGAVTAELDRDGDGSSYSWLDRLPLGAEFHMTFSALSREDTEKNIENKEKFARRSATPNAQRTLEEAAHAKKEFTKRNYLYPTQVGCFVSATSEEELEHLSNDVSSKLQLLNYRVLAECYDDNDKLDKYVRFMPGNYDMRFDNLYRTARLTYVRDIAAIIPIGYGRSSGAKVPLYHRYNRNGEVIFKNPSADRRNNLHQITLGTTGAGKSVTAASQIIADMAMQKPYLAVIDAGESFDFVIDYFKHFPEEFSVNKIKIEKVKGIPSFSLNPFYNTKEWIKQNRELENLKLLDKQKYEQKIQESIEHAQSKYVEYVGADANQSLVEKEVEEIEQRDYIAEFLNSALIMATNGRGLEASGLSDHHKRDLVDVINELMLEIEKEDPDRQLLPEHIKDRLFKKANENIYSDNELIRNSAKRCDELYSGFKTFLDSALNRIYFNRPAKAMKEYDVSYFELGIWKLDNPENKAPRALAISNFISQIITQCEARRTSDRRTKLVIDEVHIPLSDDLTASSIVLCAKIARKMGLDLDLYSQDPKDLSGSAIKLLNNVEHFELLDFGDDTALVSMSQKLSRIKDKELALARSIQNERFYKESLIVNGRRSLLSRSVAISEVIELAKNEPDEISARVAVAKKYDCDQVAAAIIQAQIARGEEPSLESALEDLGVAA